MRNWLVSVAGEVAAVVVELPVSKHRVMAWLGSAEEKSVKNMVTAVLESRSSRNCFRFVQEGALHPVLAHKLFLMLTYQVHAVTRTKD
jgi:hypothetical protein